METTDSEPVTAEVLIRGDDMRGVDVEPNGLPVH